MEGDKGGRAWAHVFYNPLCLSKHIEKAQEGSKSKIRTLTLETTDQASSLCY